MQRETKTIRLSNGYIAQVQEIRSDDTPSGTYPGGLWHGYELRIRDAQGAVPDTAQIGTHGYPTAVSMEISPDGVALAIKATGNDGYEQEDHTLGIYEIRKTGKIQTLYHEQREGGHIVTEYPRVFWLQNNQVKVEWIATSVVSSEVAESITVDRPASKPSDNEQT